MSKIENLKLPKQIAVEELDFVPAARAAIESDSEFDTDEDSESSDALDMDDWLKEFSRGSE